MLCRAGKRCLNAVTEKSKRCVISSRLKCHTIRVSCHTQVVVEAPLRCVSLISDWDVSPFGRPANSSQLFHAHFLRKSLQISKGKRLHAGRSRTGDERSRDLEGADQPVTGAFHRLSLRIPVVRRIRSDGQLEGLAKAFARTESGFPGDGGGLVVGGFEQALGAPDAFS